MVTELTALMDEVKDILARRGLETNRPINFVIEIGFLENVDSMEAFLGARQEIKQLNGVNDVRNIVTNK